jgi:hypothetical protein
MNVKRMKKSLGNAEKVTENRGALRAGARGQGIF